MINGAVTCPGSRAEGLMMNVRMVNAVFEDANDATRPAGFEAQALTTASTATPARAGAYFPPAESRGGWRMLGEPDEVRNLGGMDPEKLAAFGQWLLASDQREFAAVVVRRGHVVLEVERGNSAKTDARRVSSVPKAVCATVLAIASERSRLGLTPRAMSFEDPAFQFIPWAQPLSDPRKASITVKQLLNHTSGLCPEATGAPNDGSWNYIFGHSGDPRTAALAFDPGSACGYSTHASPGCSASSVNNSISTALSNVFDAQNAMPVCRMRSGARLMREDMTPATDDNRGLGGGRGCAWRGLAPSGRQANLRSVSLPT